MNHAGGEHIGYSDDAAHDDYEFESVHPNLFEEYSDYEVRIGPIQGKIRDLIDLCPEKDNPEKMRPELVDSFVINVLNENEAPIKHEHEELFKRDLESRGRELKYTLAEPGARTIETGTEKIAENAFDKPETPKTAEANPETEARTRRTSKEQEFPAASSAEQDRHSDRESSYLDTDRRAAEEFVTAVIGQDTDEFSEASLLEESRDITPAIPQKESDNAQLVDERLSSYDLDEERSSHTLQAISTRSILTTQDESLKHVWTEEAEHEPIDFESAATSEAFDDIHATIGSIVRKFEAAHESEGLHATSQHYEHVTYDALIAELDEQFGEDGYLIIDSDEMVHAEVNSDTESHEPPEDVSELLDVIIDEFEEHLNASTGISGEQPMDYEDFVAELDELFGKDGYLLIDSSESIEHEGAAEGYDITELQSYILDPEDMGGSHSFVESGEPHDMLDAHETTVVAAPEVVIHEATRVVESELQPLTSVQAVEMYMNKAIESEPERFIAIAETEEPQVVIFFREAEQVIGAIRWLEDETQNFEIDNSELLTRYEDRLEKVVESLMLELDADFDTAQVPFIVGELLSRQAPSEQLLTALQLRERATHESWVQAVDGDMPADNTLVFGRIVGGLVLKHAWAPA